MRMRLRFSPYLGLDHSPSTGAGVWRPASKGPGNVPCARSAARPRGGKPKAKAKAATRSKLHLPRALEQRHLDLIGLFLIAAGVYLSFVLFFGWDGGKVGYGLETGSSICSATVGARIFTVLMLLIGGLLVTGTSISTLFRGIGRGLRRSSSAAAVSPRPRSRPGATVSEEKGRRRPSPLRPKPGRPT